MLKSMLETTKIPVVNYVKYLRFNCIKMLGKNNPKEADGEIVCSYQ